MPSFWGILVLCLLSSSTMAATVTLAITGAAHVSFGVGSSQTGGSLVPGAVYGDGPNTGVSPGNVCINGTGTTCASQGYVAGNNGAYWLNATPTAAYSGTITYDDVTGTVTGGSLAWSGTYGAEFTVNSGTNVGGSFYGAQFSDGIINLATGARSGVFRCDVGAAGAVLIGAALCSQQSASIYDYAGQAGNPLQNVRAFTFTDNLDGTGLLTLQSNRFTLSNSGNNVQEIFSVSIVPVPAAVWLFGSALGALGWLRRQTAG